MSFLMNRKHSSYACQFLPACCNGCLTGARPSAKWTSSNWENRVHWMPLGLSTVVLVAIQSMMTRKRMEEMLPLSHSRLYRKPLREAMSHDDTALKLFVEWFYDGYYLRWYPKGMQYLSTCLSLVSMAVSFLLRRRKISLEFVGSVCV